MANLTDLPGEILTDILLYLDALDLLRCARVCRQLYSVVRSTKTLQYHLELGISGFVDGRTKENVTEKWMALERFDNACRGLNWKTIENVSLTETTEIWELYGGIMASALRESDATWNIAVHELVSHRRTVRRDPRLWMLENVKPNLTEVSVDPVQGLIILMCKIPNDPVPEDFPYMLEISLRDIATNEPHPDCALDTLQYTPQNQLLPCTYIKTQVVEHVLGVFLSEKEFSLSDTVDSELVVWNWKTGERLLVITDMKGYVSFCCLSTRYIWVSHIGSPGAETALDDAWSPSLDVYDLEDCRTGSIQSGAGSCLRFMLPRSERHCSPTVVKVQVQPAPYTMPSGTKAHVVGSGSSALFTLAPASRVIVARLEYVRNRDSDSAGTFLFIPLSTVLSHLNSAPSSNKNEEGRVLQWNEWGPDGSRIILPKQQNFLERSYLPCGTRVVQPMPITDDDGKFSESDYDSDDDEYEWHLTVLDFNQLTVKRVDIQLQLQAEKGGSSEFLFRPNSKTRVCREPTVIRKEDAHMEEDIETRLPYLETWRIGDDGDPSEGECGLLGSEFAYQPSTFNCFMFMMTEDAIVVVKAVDGGVCIRTLSF